MGIASGPGAANGFALKDDGSLWGWGRNVAGEVGIGTFSAQEPVPAELTGITRVTRLGVGGDHTLALRSDGSVWSWGANSGGQLGDGTTSDNATPKPVPGVVGVVDVAGGSEHSLALTSDGKVLSWGLNHLGQLGLGTQVGQLQPVDITAGLPIVATPFFSHTPAVYTDVIRVLIGSATATATIHYTLDGSVPDQTDPERPGGLGLLVDAPLTLSAKGFAPGLWPSAVAQVTYGFRVAAPVPSQPPGAYLDSFNLTVALASSGAEVRFTDDGTIPTATSPLFVGPVLVSSSVDYIFRGFRAGWQPSEPVVASYEVAAYDTIAAGADFSLVVDDAGAVWAWGANDHGQLGVAGPAQRSQPALVPGIPPIIAVSASGLHALALDSMGGVWAWGGNAAGQVGNGSTVDVFSPVLLTALPPAMAIAAGAEHSLVIDNQGYLWSWGSNARGQLGDTQASRSAPAQIVDPAGFRDIAAGQYHSIAMGSGAVWVWGANDRGQLGDGSTTDRTLPFELPVLSSIRRVRAGRDHSFALAKEVWGWGANERGQLGVGNHLDFLEPWLVGIRFDTETIRGISGGGAHSLMVDLRGRLWSWGSDDEGQLGGDGDGEISTPRLRELAGVIQATAGMTHSLAVTVDGRVWAWGDNSRGQVGLGGTVAFEPVRLSDAGFAWQTPPPAVSPASGTYQTELSVSVTDAQPGVEHHYTLDGASPSLSDPVATQGTPIAVDRSLALRVRSWSAGSAPSAIVTRDYVLQVATPDLSPAGGAFPGPVSVVVTCATPGVTLHYTRDGSEPDDSDPVVIPGASVDVAAGLELRAKGFRSGWNASSTRAATFELPLPAPIIAPAGGVLTSAQAVTLTSHVAGSAIRYTLDGTEPGFRSPHYAGPLTIGASVTLKARAFSRNWQPSGTAVATFSLSGGVVEAPQFGVAPGRYATLQAVALSSATAGATLRVSLTDLDPTIAGPVVPNGSSLSVDRSLTLGAAAWKDGLATSSVSRGSYEITGAVAAGERHTLALASDGSVLAWGDNTSGQLGDGAGDPHTTPFAVPGLVNVVAVAAGRAHSLALLGDGTVSLWGDNSAGQLGDGSLVGRLSPGVVPALAGIQAIAAGGDSSYAIATDGSVYAWGANASGQLGDGTQEQRPAPVQLASVNVVALAASGAHVLALESDGTVLAWGEGSAGQLGDGGVGGATAPQDVPGLTGITAVAAGGAASFALKTDGTASGALLAWGAHGLLAPSLDLQVVMERVTAVSFSGGRGLVITSDQAVWAWGENAAGQVGDGSNRTRPSALRIQGPDAVVQVAAGGLHSVALARDGSVWTWGGNDAGQLGDGLGSGRSLASPLAGLSLADGSWLGEDPDGDGLSTGIELLLGGDPYSADSNGDGVLDGDAVALGLSLGGDDTDGDGLSNAAELVGGTDPLRADTDGDGVPDGVDAFPLDPTRSDLTSNPSDTTGPTITIIQPTDAVKIP